MARKRQVWEVCLCGSFRCFLQTTRVQSSLQRLIFVIPGWGEKKVPFVCLNVYPPVTETEGGQRVFLQLAF